MLKLSYRPLAFTSYKAFFRRFYIIFEEKYFSCYILLNDQISFLVAFTSCDIGKYAYCNCLITRLWRHKFWNWPYLSNQAIFSTWPKRSFYMIIFKGLSWKQIKQIFFEIESPTLEYWNRSKFPLIVTKNKSTSPTECYFENP